MANVLSLVIDVNNQPGNKAIDGFNSKASTIDQTFARASQGAGRSLASIDQASVRVAASVKNSFSGIGAALGLTGIASLVKDTFNLVNGIERSRIGLQAFIGDATRANALFRDIQDFAAKSPFEFKDLLDGGNRLLALGLDAKSIIPTLKGVSQATAAVGGENSLSGFQNVIHALGQIKAEGRVTGVTLNELGRNSIPALKYLADGFGVTTGQMKKLVEEGVVPADAAIRILTSGMTEQFGKFNEEVNKLPATALSNLKDTIGRLADDVAKDKLPAITDGINGVGRSLQGLASFVKTHTGEIEGVGRVLGQIGIAIVSYKVIQLLVGVGTAIRGIGAAAAANPWLLLATGVAFVAVELYRYSHQMTAADKISQDAAESISDLKKATQDLITGPSSFTKLATDATLASTGILSIADAITAVDTAQKKLDSDKLAQFANSTLDANRQPLFGPNIGTAEFMAQAARNLTNGLLPKAPVEGFTGPDKAAVKKRKEELDYALRQQEEAAHKAADADKRSGEILLQAQTRELTGLARITEQFRQYRAELGLTAKSRTNLAQAEKLDLGTEGVKELEALAKTIARIHRENGREADLDAQQQLDYRTDLFQQELDQRAQARDVQSQNLHSLLDLEAAAVSQSRDAQLRGVESVNAVTIEQKIAVEQEKAGIERNYLQQSLALKKEMLDLDQSIEVTKAGKNKDLVFQIDKKYELARRQLVQATDAEVAAVNQNAAISSGKIIQDQNKQTFDSFKTQAEGVFDALTRSAKGGWAEIGNALKTTLLTAFKDIVTSQVALQLFKLVNPGQSVSLVNPNGKGGVASLLGLGSIPAFGQQASNGAPQANPIQQLQQVVGGPGGTGGFNGRVSGLGGVFGGGNGSGGLGALFGSLFKKGPTGLELPAGALAKDLPLSIPDAALRSPFPATGLFGSLSKFAKSPTSILTGGLLALQGFGKPGLFNAASSIGGAALSGFGIGALFGPGGGAIGAGIGAAIGGIGALIALFKGTAEGKIVDKVKALYGIDIDKKFARENLLPIIQQQYGGNIDLGIRDGQVRNLLELYSMSKGQNSQGIVTRATPSVFASSGGVFRQVATIQNGQAVKVGDLASASSASAPAPPPTTIHVASLTLQMPDGASMGDLIEARAVKNPRTISRANDAGQTQRASRQSQVAGTNFVFA